MVAPYMCLSKLPVLHVAEGGTYTVLPLPEVAAGERLVRTLIGGAGTGGRPTNSVAPPALVLVPGCTMCSAVG